jgi:hypothetical protein
MVEAPTPPRVPMTATAKCDAWPPARHALGRAKIAWAGQRIAELPGERLEQIVVNAAGDADRDRGARR